MQMSIRAMGFAALLTGIWVCDARCRSMAAGVDRCPPGIQQTPGQRTAALSTLHEQGNLADDVALGATALAAIACFGSWRPA